MEFIFYIFGITLMKRKLNEYASKGTEGTYKKIIPLGFHPYIEDVLKAGYPSKTVGGRSDKTSEN